MKVFKVPLTSSPNQTFMLTVPLTNKSLSLQIKLSYNEIAKYWQMTIQDSVTKDDILVNIPLLAGEDLLGQFEYKEIGFAAILKETEIDDDIPDDNNLGIDFVLYWGEK